MSENKFIIFRWVEGNKEKPMQYKSGKEKE